MLRRLLVTASLLTAFAAAGCGGASSTKGPQNVTPTVSTTATGGRSFSAPQMALHFAYPPGLRVIALAPSRRVTGNTAQSTHAAVGLGDYDLLVVTRFPKRPIPVTATNLPRLKAAFDKTVGQTFSQNVSGRIASVGGQPALLYDAVPTPDLPVQATTRPTLVFYRDDEYELQCQATPARRAAIARACDEMLASLHFG